MPENKKESKKEIREDYMSARAFAKRVGVNHTSILEAMNRGEIVKGIYIHPNNGHRKLIFDIAYEEYINTRSHSALAVAARENGKNNKGGVSSDDEKEKGASGRANIQAARLQKQKLDIAEKAIKLQQLKGELVNKKEVYGALFNYGKLLRDTIMNVPDRIIDRLIACEERNEAHTLLTDILREALEQLANTDSFKLTNDG